MGAARARRPRQADADRAAGARAVRAVGRAADRGEHRQTGQRRRADRRRTARRAVDVRRRSAVRPSACMLGDEGRRGIAAAARSSRRRVASTSTLPEPLGARRRVRPLGNRHGGRRRAARHQSVRRAERPAGEGCDARAARPTIRATGSCRSPPPDRTLPNGVALTLSAAAADALGGASRRSVPHAASPGRLLRPARVSRTGRPALARGAAAAPHRRARSHARGDDVRLRAALPALDRPAAQGRAEHRRVRADHRGAAADDLPIPGEPFSFGTLELAQALGDFASLDATGRRALHVHLPRPDAALVDALDERC